LTTSHQQKYIDSEKLCDEGTRDEPDRKIVDTIAWHTLPAKLTRTQFEAWFLPCFSCPKRGPTGKMPLVTIFNAILHLLDPGCQRLLIRVESKKAHFLGWKHLAYTLSNRRAAYGDFFVTKRFLNDLPKREKRCQPDIAKTCNQFSLRRVKASL